MTNEYIIYYIEYLDSKNLVSSFNTKSKRMLAKKIRAITTNIIGGI